jgi:hypothetical protein
MGSAHGQQHIDHGSLDMSDSNEPFVSVERIVEFISTPRPQVLRMTRSKVIRAYPTSGQQRHTWKYRISEVAEDIARLGGAVRSIVKSSSPRSSRTKEMNHGQE